MKRPKHLMSIALLFIAAFLLLTGTAAAGGGVIHYWGDEIVDLTEDPDGNPLPYIPDPSPLPGGRLLFEGWLDGSHYKVDPDVTMDLIGGNWYFTVDAILQPSGVMKIWGTGTSYLDYFDGLGCEEEGGGGWLGTFHGLLLANGDAIVNGRNEGCGELEGWTMKHHEEWRGGHRTFSGYFKPGD
jgi:hypothetical protein